MHYKPTDRYITLIHDAVTITSITVKDTFHVFYRKRKKLGIFFHGAYIKNIYIDINLYSCTSSRSSESIKVCRKYIFGYKMWKRDFLGNCSGSHVSPPSRQASRFDRQASLINYHDVMWASLLFSFATRPSLLSLSVFPINTLCLDGNRKKRDVCVCVHQEHLRRASEHITSSCD